MKRNGFTLIELLAVIVILAIIAVIATPIVLNTIDDAKKGAAKSGTYSYIEEVETEVSSYMIKNSGARYAAGKYNVATLKTDLGVEVKGDAPSEGNVCIASNGTVSNASIKINGYVVSYDGKEATTTDKREIEDITCNGEVALVGDPVLDKAKTLVYDENGVCKTDDTTYNYMGGCYIKSNVNQNVSTNNNYIWYNGFMWRIMGINSDNTVRLITDENVTNLAYGASGTAETYATNEGYIHDWLNEWFLNHLNSTQSIIQEGEYFCSETTTSSSRRTTCTDKNKVKAKIGLISIDEYVLANSTGSYLNIKQTSWTMTPYNGNSAWIISGGSTLSNPIDSYMYGVRPIINVRSNATITAGDGTASNFYVLGEDKSISSKDKKLGEKVTSGEYIKLEGKTYRVVDKVVNNNENDYVKLILDGFYEETEGTAYTMSYGNNNTFTLDSGIGLKLNTDVLTWLGFTSDDERLANNITYYQGDEIGFVTTYIDALKQSNKINAKVGLIKIGDMLAGQSSTMLTKNYTTTSNSSNTKSYWTMNKYTSASEAWYVCSSGNAYCHSWSNTFGVRPVIKVKTSLTISGGNGTWKSPYEI